MEFMQNHSNHPYKDITCKKKKKKKSILPATGQV